MDDGQTSEFLCDFTILACGEGAEELIEQLADGGQQALQEDLGRRGVLEQDLKQAALALVGELNLPAHIGAPAYMDDTPAGEHLHTVRLAAEFDVAKAVGTEAWRALAGPMFSDDERYLALGSGGPYRSVERLTGQDHGQPWWGVRGQVALCPPLLLVATLHERFPQARVLVHLSRGPSDPGLLLAVTYTPHTPRPPSGERKKLSDEELLAEVEEMVQAEHERLAREGPRRPGQEPEDPWPSYGSLISAAAVLPEGREPLEGLLDLLGQVADG